MELETQLQVARNLKFLRKSAKLSQCTLSDNISVCRSTYCQYEQGDRLPDVNTLHTLSNFYHLKIDTLINFDIPSAASEFFLNQEFTHDESGLISLYKKLTSFSQGRLIERAEELAQLEAIKRRNMPPTFRSFFV